MFRRRSGELQVLLVHPGGPFWAGKDAGSWTVPKGELDPGESEIDAAKREFEEETGFKPVPPFLPLGQVKQKSGKIVHAWAFESDCDPEMVRSVMFDMEWPPKSGRMQEFPEVDRAAFFALHEAREKITPAQVEFLDALQRLLGN